MKRSLDYLKRKNVEKWKPRDLIIGENDGNKEMPSKCTIRLVKEKSGNNKISNY